MHFNIAKSFAFKNLQDGFAPVILEIQIRNQVRKIDYESK
jgi:hypothetical protein